MYFKDLAAVEEWIKDEKKVSAIGARMLYDAYLRFKLSRVKSIYEDDIQAMTV